MFPNALSLFGHTSLKVIIVTWVLTAFIPLPLIFGIFLIRHFPDSFAGLKFSSLFLLARRGNKRSRALSSTNHPASTPSSHTLAGSNVSSYTLPTLNIRSNSPPAGHFSSPTTHTSSSTPQKSSQDSSRNPTAPATSTTSQDSNGSSKKPPGSSNPLFPASESPRYLSFLEPPSLTSTPRKSYSRLPPNNPRNPSVRSLGVAPTPVLRSRRLRKLFLISAFLLFLVSVLYVLEGFAIAAAQDYAHVRVLSHGHGKGGLGKGKENETWLIPWSVYVFIEGGLVLWAVWMVNGSRKMAKRLAQECAEQKGDDDKKRPKEDASGDIELQDFGHDDENETFLPASQPGPEDVFRPEPNGSSAHDTMDEEEEKEWKALGFYRISERPNVKISSTKSHKPKLISAHAQDNSSVSANGEGSSSGPSYSRGPSFDGYIDDSGIPLPDLPGAVKQWRAERSLAEMKIQRRGSDTRDFGTDPEQSSSIPPDQDGPVQAHPTAPPPKDLRNSWEQEDDDGTRQRIPIPPRKSLKGKGKGKAKEKVEEQPETPPTPAAAAAVKKNKANAAADNHPQPDPLPTGIDLNTNYKFIDGLAYPIIPLPQKRPRRPTLEQPPPIPHQNHNNNQNNIDDIPYPFPLSYPITPSPSPTSSSQHRPRRFLQPSHPLTRFSPNHLPPQTPPPNILPPPPPLATRPSSFTFTPAPYAASATFTPSPPAHQNQQNQPAHRLPTGLYHPAYHSPTYSSSTNSSYSSSYSSTSTPPPLTPSTPSSSASPYSSSPYSSPLTPLTPPRFPGGGGGAMGSGGYIPMGRKSGQGARGKRYRRSVGGGSGLGTVREVPVGVGFEDGETEGERGQGGQGGWF